MHTGFVRRYNRMRGFGFIVPGDLSEDVFVHFSELIGQKYLRAGQHVRYELGEWKGRVVAKRVEVIEDVPAGQPANPLTQVDALAMLGAPKTAVG